MKLPSYYNHAIAYKERDLNLIMDSLSIEDLSESIYGTLVNDALSEDVIRHYLNSSAFGNGADYFRSETFLKALSSVIMALNMAAGEFGFPGQPIPDLQESKIDIALSKALIESLEYNGFVVLPCYANSRYVQEFMTQRVFPLIAYWRWRVVTRKPISKDRIISSPRNYFYTLWVSGWLFDKGIDAKSERWILLEHMSSDSLVQIIERSGLGYRKGFAQAIAAERKIRSINNSKGELDKLVRGCMKRATFTFSTTVLKEDEEYYEEICRYLFNWAEKNYLSKVEGEGQ